MRGVPVDPGSHELAVGLGVELASDAEEPLEDVVARPRAAGFEPATAIVDESHGRSFTVCDPEGLHIQVNEHYRALHGSPEGDPPRRSNSTAE